jgi:protein-tyrosine phosphatase
MAFDTLPTSDFAIPPSFTAAARVIGRAAADLRAGRGVGAHCFAGRGRSPLFIAALMVHEGYAAGDAIDAVSAARGRRVPETAAQQRWVADYADWCRSGP